MLQKISYFVKTYGSAGIPDQKAVEEFFECETDEMIRGLRSELVGLYQEALEISEDTLDLVIGVARKARHGSYQEWAKLMLQWIAAHKV